MAKNKHKHHTETEEVISETEMEKDLQEKVEENPLTEEQTETTPEEKTNKKQEEKQEKIPEVKQNKEEEYLLLAKKNTSRI